MYLKLCEHPSRIKVYDSSKGRIVYKMVKCGKCSTCLNQRASGIVERLQQESQCHPYTCFFTLTYDDKHVPSLYLNDSGTLYDPERELLVDTSDIPNFKSSSRLYVHRRKEIYYADFKDVQDFLKRLRYYINSLLLHTNEQKKIRYYIVSEYGPSTYRPHYHGLLWFDSKKIALRIHELISKSWSFGRIDAQFSRGKSHEYVARYVSSVGSLPKVYLHKSLRPRSICSKFPSIGTLAINSEEVREIFENGITERVIDDQSSHKSKVTLLWRSLENKIFPKVTGFNALNHNERVTMYSVYSLCPVEGFESFIDWCRELFRKPYITWLSDKLLELYELDMQDYNKKVVFYPKFNRLKNLYYTSSKVYWQRRIFGVSLEYYVSKIENYYFKKEQLKLKRFYQFQDDYVRKNSTPLPLLYMYDCGVKPILKFLNGSSFTNLDIVRFATFGYDVTNALSLSMSLSHASELERFDTSRFVNLNDKILWSSHKSKKHNDYIQNVKNKQKFNFNIEKYYE